MTLHLKYIIKSHLGAFLFNHLSSENVGYMIVRDNSNVHELNLFINLQVGPIHPLLFSCIISTRWGSVHTTGNLASW